MRNHQIHKMRNHWMLLVTMLKKTAEKKGISQQMIVERTWLKKSNLSRMFALQQSPTLRTFLLVARAIGVNFFFEDRDGDTNLTAIFEAAIVPRETSVFLIKKSYL